MAEASVIKLLITGETISYRNCPIALAFSNFFSVSLLNFGIFLPLSVLPSILEGEKCRYESIIWTWFLFSGACSGLVCASLYLSRLEKSGPVGTVEIFKNGWGVLFYQ